MKDIGVTSYDDLFVFADPEHKVLATNTKRLGLDGIWYELDLTDEHLRELMADLKRWLEAGHRPQSQLYRERPDSDQGDRPDPDSKRRANAELRDFADKHGLAYRTKTGRCTYPAYLHNAYLAWQAGAPEAEWRAVYERGLQLRKKDGRR